MRPRAGNRVTPKGALDGFDWTKGHAAYSNIAARHVKTEGFLGNVYPQLTVSEAGDRLLIMVSETLWRWDTEQGFLGHRVSLPDTQKGVPRQISMSPDGLYACITSLGGAQLPLVYDAKSLKHLATPVNFIGRSGNFQEMKISAWSPDGNTLITACGEMLSHISVMDDWTSVNQLFSAFISIDGSHLDRTKTLTGIRALRLTKDGKKLIAAYETGIVIKDATDKVLWHNIQVIEYPCALSLCSSVSISHTGVVASGTITGVLWLWTKGCWILRSYGPDVGTCEAVRNVQFLRDGENLTYSLGSHSVFKCKALPLEDMSNCCL